MNTNNIIYQLVALTIVAVISVTNAEVDCKKHPTFVHPKDCCDIPNLITEEINEKCQEFLKPSGGGPPGGGPPAGGPDDANKPLPGPPGKNRHGHGHHHGPHHHCFFSCVLNETEILIDEEFQEDNLQNYLNEALDDTETIELLSKNFHECSEEIEDMKKHFEKKGPPPGRNGHGPPHHQCPPHGGMLMGCVMMKTFNECPTSIWSDTDECNDMRDFWNECKHHPNDVDDEVVEDNEEI